MRCGKVTKNYKIKLHRDRKYQQSIQQTVKDTKGTSWYWRIAVSMVDHNVTIATVV